jgi:hypothetical protein
MSEWILPENAVKAHDALLPEDSPYRLKANPPAVAADTSGCSITPAEAEHFLSPNKPKLTDEELEDAANALDNFAEFLAEDDEIGPSKALAMKLRGMKGK